MSNSTKVFKNSREIKVISAQPQWLCLHILPDLRVRERVIELFRKNARDLPSDLIDDLSMALHELLGNAFEHGCSFDPATFVEFSCVRTSRMILLVVKDGGPGFQVEQLNHSAANNPDEDPLHHIKFRDEKGMRPGGFGILMVKQMADELIYNEAGNGVIFIKYLS